MALITDVGSKNANSYVTLEEAELYLEKRPIIKSSTWDALSETEKEYRLEIAAKLMDILSFKGVKATASQARAFPRLDQRSPLWPLDPFGKPMCVFGFCYDTWDELVTVAGFLGVDPPEVPDDIKYAQIEIAHLIVDQKIMSQKESSNSFVTYLMTGSIQMSFKPKSQIPKEAYTIINSAVMDASSMIYVLLRPYISVVRGYIV